VESYFFDMRRQLWEYDQVLNTQRDRVYGERRRALESDDLSAQMVEYAERTVDDILEVLSLSISGSCNRACTVSGKARIEWLLCTEPVTVSFELCIGCFASFQSLSAGLYQAIVAGMPDRMR